MTAHPFQIELHQSFEAVESPWAQLESEGVSTPFQHRVWMRPVYAILAPAVGAEPRILLVRDAAGAPVMLAPLCLRRRLGVPVVEFADFGVCDYNAPLIARHFAPTAEQWRTLWATARKALGEAPLLRLARTPDRIGALPNPFMLDAAIRPSPTGSWGIALPSSLAALEAALPSAKFRSNIVRARKRLAAQGKVSFDCAETPEEALGMFAELARQRAARCAAMGRRDLMALPAWRQFYETALVDGLALGPHGRPFARLATLTVDDEIVATIFALDHGHSRYMLIPTFADGRWSSFSAGTLAILEAITLFIAEGATFLDLTTGDEAYKRSLAAVRRTTFEATLGLTRAGALLAAGAPPALAALRRWRDR